MTNEPNVQLASIYLLPCKLHSRSTDPVSANEKKKQTNQEEIYRLQTRLPALHKPTKPSSPAPGGSLPGAPIHNQPEGCFSAEPQKIHLLLFTSIYTRHQATLLTPARQRLSGATSPGGDPGAGSQHAVAGEAAPGSCRQRGSSVGLAAGPVPASTTCGGAAGARARSSELLLELKCCTSCTTLCCSQQWGACTTRHPQRAPKPFQTSCSLAS